MSERISLTDMLVLNDCSWNQDANKHRKDLDVSAQPYFGQYTWSGLQELRMFGPSENQGLVQGMH